jgi:nickel/cobalt transporter (NicO) family protein
MENGQAVLEFTLVPIAPYPIHNMLEIEVTDPDYYVAFTFPESDGAVLVNPPLGCGVAATPPKPLSDDDAKLLANIGMDQVTLPPELRALVRDQTNIITVNCVAGASATPETPATALDAIDTLTRPVSLPFGGPPVELGIPMPRTGFLGWVNEQQKTFYKALSGALTALKSDGNAFFVLGLLSFLYGVFHSAGPGHGKVVISSYMLAGERQLRTGIALSFAAALAQSLTAIIFIVVAAAILRMSSVAMNGVAGSIETLSYALIVLLGIWLLVRRLFGHGHDHGHDHDHHHGHDHYHAHTGHTHHHVVVPQKGQNVREALGMVLAVGLRPCSGALIVLVFALSQGVLLAGIVSVLLMGLGTALTVSFLATLAVGAKALALRIGSRTESTKNVVAFVELAGAVLLIFFGSVMLLASLID